MVDANSNKLSDYSHVLVDFDGVLNISPMFSVIYAAEHEVQEETIVDYFRSDLFAAAKKGEADMQDHIQDQGLLDKWDWHGTAAELLHEFAIMGTELDENLLNLIRSYKTKGLNFYLATDQEKYKAKYIWEEALPKELFAGKFISCELGFTKSEAGYFQKVVETLGLTNESLKRVMLIDDSQSKIDSAIAAGISAYLYTSWQQFTEDFDVN